MTSPTITVDQEEQLWTAAQVAQFFHVSRSWVYREIAAGRMPHTRILGLVRFDPAEMRAMKEKGKQVPGRVVLPLSREST